MSPASTGDRVAAALEGLAFQTVETRDGIPTVTLARDALRAALERLRDRAGFEQNTLITGVDHFPEEPRFEVVYQFLSYEHNARVRVKVRVHGDDARLPSCADLWPGANYAERECYDMFGVRFDGHPNLKRLLMPEEYEHHPLRKDFPHGGIEPDRLYREWDRKRRQGWSPTA